MLPFAKKQYTLKHILLISAISFISNINTLFNQFVFDDVHLIVNNPNIKSLSKIPVLFSTGYWFSTGPSGGLYRPLTMLSFLFEYSVARLNPALYHLDNVLLHLLCAVLVYLILRKVLTDDVTAFFAALLFAVHPVHTEPVAWVTGRAELLSAFLGLFSAYIFLAKPRKPIYTGLFSFVFFLSLLSKESSIVIPVLLGVYLFLFEPDQKNNRLLNISKRLYPYAVAFILYMIPRVYVLGALGPTGREQTFLDVKPYYTFLTMCVAFTHYIRLAFLPFDLHVDYLFPPPFSLFEIRVLFPLALLAAVLIFSRRIIRASRPAFFSIAWFFVALLPVSNIIPVGIIMSERAMYIPSIGPCILLSLAVMKGGRLLKNRNASVAAFSSVILVPILISFSIQSFHRNPAWHDQHNFELDQIAMVRHRIQLFPDYPPFYSMLANMYIKKGDFGSEPEKLLKEAIRLDSRDSASHFVYARLYLKRNMPLKALEEANAILAYEPGNSDAYNLVGVSLHMLGGNNKAEVMLDKAIALDPRVGEYYMNKGVLRLEAGDTDGALANFIHAADLDPLLFDAYFQAGLIYGSRNQYKLAVEYLERAVELKPNDKEARRLLSAANSLLGN